MSTTTTTLLGSYPASATLAQDHALEGTTVSWFTRFKQALADWARQSAQSRADLRLWDLAQSDSRVMAELMLARKRDDAEESWVSRAYVSPVSEADALTGAEATPRQPSLMGQGWAGVIADAYQTRSRKREFQCA